MEEATPSRQHGHRRMPTMGKAMPVTSLLLNFPPPLSEAGGRASHMRGGEQERPPVYFPVERDETHSDVAEIGDSGDDETSNEPEYELLVSECSSTDEASGGGADRDDEHISLVGNSIFYTPCLTCTGSAPAELLNRATAINEMCRRLCTDECRLRLSLAGFEPPSAEALRNREALTELVRDTIVQRPMLQHTFSEDTLKGYPSAAVREGKRESIESISEEAPIAPRPQSRIAIQRKQFLTDMLAAGQHSDSSDSENSVEEAVSHENDLLQIVADIIATTATPGTSKTPTDNAESLAAATTTIVEEHELELLKDFREKFTIAEALAKTSAMTSTTQMKQRLAARKLEIERDDNAPRYNVNGDDGAAPCHSSGNQTDEEEAAAADTVATTKLIATYGSDFEPPRDLLLYLVRMGSFNSAPKINNVDSQDDGLEIPSGLNISELLQHVKHLRGDHQPPLLSRYFLRSSLGAMAQEMAITSDVTDGLRFLKLNTVSRVCSAPTSSPNHIRLLQWNILSQTLGQSNDGFVCCPEEALTWDNRKFLIVQEILQHNPDIVCLQEVDHFKFLQNILGTQNYEGIFFPKPDSPCLYIEENNGPDGCAIFYKRDKYALQSYDTRILEVWRVQSNQVAIAANLQVRATGKEVCVCTTHLKARHGSLLSKLRNEQGRDLVRFVKEFAGTRPVLLCGDFNAEPVEPVYATILSCDMLKLSSAYADVQAASEKANDDQQQSSEQAVNEEPQDDVDKVQQSMKREPAYTTWKIREDGEECHTIDYVFYTQDDFKVRNCLEFPHGEDIGKDRTPSFQYPSDHFSLVCDLELVEEQQQQQQQQQQKNKTQ